MTRRQISRMLQSEHQKRSWREISHEIYFGQIPAGTLARIAKSDGAYIPKKWRSVLGLGKSQTRRSRPQRLAEMSSADLLYCLTNRVDF